MEKKKNLFKRISVLLVLVIFVSIWNVVNFAGAAPDDGVNLFEGTEINFDFEGGSTFWPESSTIVSTGGAHSGNGYLDVSTGWEANWKGPQLQSNTWYKLSGWFKSSGGSTFLLCYVEEGKPENTTATINVPNASDWTYAEIIFRTETILPINQWDWTGVCKWAPSPFQMDDIKLEEITGPTPTPVPTVSPEPTPAPTEKPAPKKPKVKKVTLNKKKINLQVGKSRKLKATVKPKNAANKKITWKSNKPKIAKVNQKGKVTARKKGKCKITASTKNGKKAVCKVTVKPAKKKKKK